MAQNTTKPDNNRPNRGWKGGGALLIVAILIAAGISAFDGASSNAMANGLGETNVRNLAKL